MTVDELVDNDTKARMIEVFYARDGAYRWRIIGTDGRTLYTSPTRYPTRSSAHSSAQDKAVRVGVTEIIDDE